MPESSPRDEITKLFLARLPMDWTPVDEFIMSLVPGVPPGKALREYKRNKDTWDRAREKRRAEGKPQGIPRESFNTDQQIVSGAKSLLNYRVHNYNKTGVIQVEKLDGVRCLRRVERRKHPHDYIEPEVFEATLEPDPAPKTYPRSLPIEVSQALRFDKDDPNLEFVTQAVNGQAFHEIYVNQHTSEFFLRLHWVDGGFPDIYERISIKDMFRDWIIEAIEVRDMDEHPIVNKPTGVE